MKKILILTQYFKPENGAASKRAHENALEFSKLGYKVTVLCPFPNYPEGIVFSNFKKKLYYIEYSDDIRTVYIPILALGRSSSIQHYLLYFSFVFSSFIYSFFLGKFDFIYCSSPPLFIGISGFLISKFKSAKFIFEVRDLWPESVKVVKNLKDNHPIIWLGAILEKFLYYKADAIVVLTQGFINHINKVISNKKIFYAPNGISTTTNLNHSASSFDIHLPLDPNKITIGYFGVLGEAQDIHSFCSKLSHYADHFQLLILGFGSQFELIKRSNFSNTIILPAVASSRLNQYIQKIDVFLVNLIPSELFKMTIPSKIFQGLQSQKYILAGLSGEAAKIIQDSDAGIVYNVSDIEDLFTKLDYIKQNICSIRNLDNRGVLFVETNFSKNKILKDLSIFLNAL